MKMIFKLFFEAHIPSNLKHGFYL